MEYKEKRQLAWKALSEQNGERVLELIIDYHGMQMFNEGFIEHLIDEGVLEPFEEQ
jgi:hypothetical protein